MGKNYHIQFNPEEPSREKIQQHQDFDALLSAYEKDKAPAPRARIRVLRRYTYPAAAATVAAVLAFFFFRPDPAADNYRATADAFFAGQAHVNPPIESIAPDYASFAVDASQGGVYEYQSGSRLVVPRAAFVNDRGRAVTGEVNIHYREMHDFVDFFLGGIPMVYDSAGVRYNLESAGMIEIYAEQDGQKVRMAPGKSIDVELVSVIDVPNINVPPRYNIYRLDTAARNWVYTNVDRIQIIEDEVLEQGDPRYPFKRELAAAIAEIDAGIEAELAAFERRDPPPAKPTAPKPADGEAPTLELDPGEFDDEQVVYSGGARAAIRQLRSLAGNIIWQVSPESPPYDERAFNVQWQEIRFHRVDDWTYELQLVHSDNTVELIINPVLTDGALDAAMESYERALAQYQNDLEAWESRREAYRRQLLTQTAPQREAARRRYNEQIEGLNLDPNAATAYVNRRKVINRFKANSFGIWNCDRPIPPSMAKLRARFVDEEGRSFKNGIAFLADRSQNTIYRFLVTEETPIHFNTNSDNLLWIVDEQDNIAVFRPEAFKQIRQTDGQYTFQMERIDRKVETEADVREVLQFN